MACYASVAAFQAKWGVGPCTYLALLGYSPLFTRSTAGLSGFTLFITVVGMLLSSFMLGVPVIYDKYDKFTNLARALKEVRVGFILTGIGTTFSMLIAYVQLNWPQFIKLTLH